MSGKKNRKNENIWQALKHCLKDFKSDTKSWDGGTAMQEERIDIPPSLSPPSYMIFLTFVGLLKFKYWGKEEKILWTIPISYKGHPFLLSHRKFGFRVHSLIGKCPNPDLTKDLLLTLNKSVRIADQILQPEFQHRLKNGHFTIINKYIHLSNMYNFFRKKAKDTYCKKEPKPKVLRTDKDGKPIIIERYPLKYKFEAYYYVYAMIDAYFSRLEHLLIILLPFIGFDTKTDSIVKLISSQWTPKFKRVFSLDTDEVARSHYEKLKEIKEKYRNVISHGFFQKGDASLLAHMSVVGSVPLYISNFDEHISLSMIPIIETTYKEICDAFDGFENFLRSSRLSYGLRYAESGLDFAFDDASQTQYQIATKSEESFTSFIEYQNYLDDLYANMDW